MSHSDRKCAPETTGLIWFRGGLRLQDNACVYHALQENTRVYGLYVLDDHYMRGKEIGAARAAFLLDSLHQLSEQLRQHGGGLIVRRVQEEVPSEVVSVARELGAGRIYINRDYLPYPIQRDEQTAQRARQAGSELRSYADTLLVEPDRVLTNDQRPYTVFSPFKRRWESLLRLPDRYAIEPLVQRFARASHVKSVPLPTLQEYGLALTQQIEPGGERRAVARLEEFAQAGLPCYHENRDNASDPDSTSRLSMHIKWGTISLRDCYRQAQALGGPGAAKWIDELAWREFFYAITYHFPHALDGPMLPEYSGFPWSTDPDHLQAWKAGMTGYPFVDAGMRQLNATGWMHNRLRQVTASYLCKDLLINWQEGERYFMQMLTCGDWPSNNGGWQWVAGTGTDPRRATRIFNPTLQRERYDPTEEYVRQWIPEYGTRRYPAPIVPHDLGRERFMRAFGSTAEGRQALREAYAQEAKQRRASEGRQHGTHRKKANAQRDQSA